MSTDPRPEDVSAPHQQPFGAGERLCLAAVGLGLGLQAASLFRLATRVGLGTPADDFLFGAVATLLIGLGALLFGPLARTVSPTGWSLSSCAAAALGTLALSVVAAMTSPLGFKAHCARFDADASLAGTPLVDMSAALVMLILPAFGLGAVLRSRRGWADFLAFALGFVAAWAWRPQLFGAMESVDWKNSGSSGLVLWGAAIAGAGVLFRGLLGRSGKAVGGLAGAAVVTAAALLPISAIDVYHPWQRFPKKPLRIFETPAGQFTVQPAKLAGGSVAGFQVLLDQRPISPDGVGLKLEAQCLQRTFDAYRATGAAWPPQRTLVVGLVTRERAELLAQAGVSHFHRTAVWWRDMEKVESLIWSKDAPPGQLVGPDPIAEGEPYDLVLTFPMGAYRAAGWDLRLVDEVDGRVKAAWLPWDMGVQATFQGADLALVSSGLEAFAFGLVSGEDVRTAFETHPARVQDLSPEWMETRPEARPYFTLRESTVNEPALRRHAEAQRISSPFEDPLERIELDPEALELWRDRALDPTEEPSPYLRGVLEGAAEAAMAQRQVPWIFEYLAPVAERFPDWLQVQAAVAQAEAEELDFAAAIERLRPLVAAHPKRRDLAVLLSDALAGLGDPEGRAIAQGLLRDDPDNPLLFGLARGVRGMTTLGQPGGYESLTADEASGLADGAFLGLIEDVSVEEVDPGDGAPLYLTTLRVRGTPVALLTLSATVSAPADAEEIEREVVFLGGFLDGDRGSFNSTAPPAHQTRVGRRILYFFDTQDDIAGGVGGDALLRGRAGLFTAFETRDRRVIVQGRGNAAAIPYNVVCDEL